KQNTEYDIETLLDFIRVLFRSPIILVIIIAVPTVIATFDLADASDSDDHMNINVTGKQFWWHFDYEDKEIETSQDMYIPVDTKVYLNLFSEDVTHSFWEIGRASCRERV